MGSIIDNPTPSTRGLRYGQRLLPQVVDKAAITTPERVVGIVAKSSDICLGFTKVSMASLSRAINFAAHWIDGHVGHVSPMQTYAYVGVADFRYMIMELAAIKCCHQALIFSPRNALSHNSTLFNDVNCYTLFYSVEVETLAKALADKLPGLDIFQVPTYQDMIEKPVETYPYLKTWDEAKDDKFVILHTSGSTRAPKALSFTNGYFATFDSWRFVPSVNGKSVSNPNILDKGILTYFGSPMFHMGGIGFAICVLFYNHALVLGPTTEVPTGKIVVDIMREVEIGAMIVIPSLLESVCKGHRQEFVTIPKHWNMCSGLEVRRLTSVLFCKQNHTPLICFPLQGHWRNLLGILLSTTPKQHSLLCTAPPKQALSTFSSLLDNTGQRSSFIQPTDPISRQRIHPHPLRYTRTDGNPSREIMTQHNVFFSASLTSNNGGQKICFENTKLSLDFGSSKDGRMT